VILDTIPAGEIDELIFDRQEVELMKFLNRSVFLMIALSLVCSAYADDKAFFNTFMRVCTKNIDDVEVITKMTDHFHFKELPREFWPPSENFKAWIYAVEKERYVLSIDKVNGSNICGLEAVGANERYTRLLLKGFFIEKGKLDLAKTISEDKSYIWQELYKGYDKELGIDCFFAIKKRRESITLVVMQPNYSHR
jgi:hypothetical protein